MSKAHGVDNIGFRSSVPRLIPVLGLRVLRRASTFQFRNPKSAISAWSLSCGHSEPPGGLVTTVGFRKTTLPDTISHHFFGEFRFSLAARNVLPREKR
jgi:hypothetical protein